MFPSDPKGRGRHSNLPEAEALCGRAIRSLAAVRKAAREIGKRFGAQGEGLSIYVYDPEDNLVELKGTGHA